MAGSTNNDVADEEGSRRHLLGTRADTLEEAAGGAPPSSGSGEGDGAQEAVPYARDPDFPTSARMYRALLHTVSVCIASSSAGSSL